MRTTVDLPEHLLLEAKKLAAERRIPVTRVIEESLRAHLNEQRRQHAATPAVVLPVLHEPRLLEGVDLDDTSHLWEIE